jgi:hypothetical protein
MKNVLEILFPYILLLYAFDCITHVNARHVLLSSFWGKKFALKRSGVRLAGLLPVSQTIVAHNLPLYYSQDGVYAVFDGPCANNRIDQAEDLNFIAFDDLQRIEVVGKNLKLNGTGTLKTPSPASARFLAKFLNQLKLAAPAVRKKIIRTHLADAYDLEAVRKTAASGAKSLTVIKVLSCGLFGLAFLELPLLLFSDLFGPIHLYGALICIGLVYLLLLRVVLPTLKKLYWLENDLRSSVILSLVFSPVTAAHVLSYLTKDLYCRFNYLAVAAHFLPRTSFQEIARKELLLVGHYENAVRRPDWRQFWIMKKEMLLGLLTECEISLPEILAAPEKQDQTAAFYCPFCRTEYREKRPVCLDCEMALQEFGREPSGRTVD